MKRVLVLGGFCLVLAWPGWAQAPGQEELNELRATVREQAIVIEALRERLDAIEAKAEETQEQVTLAKEQIEEVKERKPESKPEDFRVYWKDGLKFETQDKRFKMQVGGRIQADWAWFDHGDEYKIIGRFFDFGLNDEEDGTEFRRARLFVSGDLYERIQFKAQYDFAANSPGDDSGKFKDAYIALNDIPYVGQVKVGHFKEPFSLEELTSSKYITFMERALPNVFSPGRNMGVQVSNTALEDRIRWAAGAFKTVDDWPSDNDSDEDQGWAWTGRVSGVPWYADDGRKLLHLGASYTHRNPDGNIRYRQRPEAHLANRYVDTRGFDLVNNRRAGDIRADAVDVYDLESALVIGPWSLQGEYMKSEVDSTFAGDLDFDSYYIQTSYFLTGENRRYKLSEGAFDRVKPKRNFGWGEDAGPGAWELALRYSSIDLNSGEAVRGGEEDNITAAVNWYLNPNTRVMLNYIKADINHDLYDDDVDIVQMRFQIDF